MKQQGKGSEMLIIRALLFSLCAYYIYVVLSFVFVFILPKSPVSLPFALLFSENAIRELEVYREINTPLPAWWIASVRTLHRGDPEVVNELVIYGLSFGSYNRAMKDANKLLDLDPKNPSRYALYLSVLPKAGKTPTIGDEVRLLSAEFLSSGLRRRVESGLSVYPPVYGTPASIPVQSLEKVSAGAVPSLLARMFYFIGLSRLPGDSRGALYWWLVAADTDPSVSYYAVESAALLARQTGGGQKAMEVLRVCQKNTSARTHCRQTEEDMDKGVIPQAGALQDLVRQGLSDAEGI